MRIPSIKQNGNHRFFLSLSPLFSLFILLSNVCFFCTIFFFFYTISKKIIFFIYPLRSFSVRSLFVLVMVVVLCLCVCVCVCSSFHYAVSSSAHWRSTIKSNATYDAMQEHDEKIISSTSRVVPTALHIVRAMTTTVQFPPYNRPHQMLSPQHTHSIRFLNALNILRFIYLLKVCIHILSFSLHEETKQ